MPFLGLFDLEKILEGDSVKFGCLILTLESILDVNKLKTFLAYPTDNLI